MRNFIDYQNLWRYRGTYSWVSGELVPGSSGPAKSDRVLSTALPLGAYDQAAYNPPPDLFLIFGATLLTKEGIKSFADKYGLLGLGEHDGGVPLALEIAPGDAPPAPLPFQNACKTPTLGSGELLSSWRREIRAMRDATNLWSAIRQSAAGDSRSLARHVKWLESDFVYYDSDPHVPLPPTSWLLGIPPDGRANSFGEEADTGQLRTLAVIASRAHNSKWLRWFRAGECAMPAHYYLQQSVNEKLRNRVSPKLLWNVPRSRPQDLALYLVSDNLLGAVWLQFAELINGNKPLRRCAACQSWIVISTEDTGKRSNRSTCSNACRMKIYEQRKKEAQRLRQQGLSAREIAKLLRADQERVRKWIGPTRTGQKAPNLKKR